MSRLLASLKPLESLAGEVAQALSRISKEKEKLSRLVASLTEENRVLRDRLKQASESGALHKKIRKRLEKISSQLDKIV